MRDAPVLGGVEAGGTKFVCALGTGPDDVRRVARFPTTTPEETLERAIGFFRGGEAGGADTPREAPGDVSAETARGGAGSTGPAAVGIGSFGPVDVDPDSPTFGCIGSTPKAGWSGVRFAGRLESELGVPVGFDTDVNAAALGEWKWGAARGLDTFVYLTVGTGIGGGGMANGALLHGLQHPEMGHIRVPHDRDADPFEGTCPFHGDCLEGLASGPAIAARWGVEASELPAEHPAWALEAEYLAHALATYTCTLSPQRIILGGGVMHRARLFPRIRERVRELLGGYLASPAVGEEIDRFIVPPGLGDRAGMLGAIALAERALGR